MATVAAGSIRRLLPSLLRVDARAGSLNSIVSHGSECARAAIADASSINYVARGTGNPLGSARDLALAASGRSVGFHGARGVTIAGSGRVLGRHGALGLPRAGSGPPLGSQGVRGFGMSSKLLIPARAFSSNGNGKKESLLRNWWKDFVFWLQSKMMLGKAAYEKLVFWLQPKLLVVKLAYKFLVKCWSLFEKYWEIFEKQYNSYLKYSLIPASLAVIYSLNMGPREFVGLLQYFHHVRSQHLKAEVLAFRRHQAKMHQVM